MPLPRDASAAVAPRSMRYERPVVAGGAGLNCAVLDPAIFAHAAVSLRDLRLVGADGREVPFVLTLSGTGQDETESVAAADLQRHANGIGFDLRMPARPYTDVILDLAATDFVATATVTAAGRPLGEFAVWDLSREGLGRSSTLHLAETAAPVLHVEIRPVSGGAGWQPETVRGAAVPPTRMAQTRYTVAARAGVRQEAGTTVAELDLPARVPVEQIRFLVSPGRENFRRAVRVQARAASGEVETVSGEIDRLHLRRGGVTLDDERLAVPATLGANLQAAARVRVELENDGAPALPILAVDLLSRERQVCFDAATAGERMDLLYGDARLHAPAYAEYTRRYATEAAPATARIGTERQNAAYAGDLDDRTLRQRHPRLGYLGLLLVVCFGGLLVLRAERLRLGGGGR